MQAQKMNKDLLRIRCEMRMILGNDQDVDRYFTPGAKRSMYLVRARNHALANLRDEGWSVRRLARALDMHESSIRYNLGRHAEHRGRIGAA